MQCREECRNASRTRRGGPSLATASVIVTTTGHYHDHHHHLWRRCSEDVGEGGVGSRGARDRFGPPAEENKPGGAGRCSSSPDAKICWPLRKRIPTEPFVDAEIVPRARERGQKENVQVSGERRRPQRAFHGQRFQLPTTLGRHAGQNLGAAAQFPPMSARPPEQQAAHQKHPLRAPPAAAPHLKSAASHVLKAASPPHVHCTRASLKFPLRASKYDTPWSVRRAAVMAMQSTPRRESAKC